MRKHDSKTPEAYSLLILDQSSPKATDYQPILSDNFPSILKRSSNYFHVFADLSQYLGLMVMELSAK